MSSEASSGRWGRPLALGVASLVLIGASGTLYTSLSSPLSEAAPRVAEPQAQPRLNLPATPVARQPTNAEATVVTPVAPRSKAATRSIPTASHAQTRTALRTPPAARTGAASELVALRVPHRAWAGRSAASTPLELVPSKTPITESTTVLPVLARKGQWLKVRLPGRPNGHTGWIRKQDTTRVITDWRLIIDRSRRQVIVMRAGRRVRLFSSIVGSPSTPTPRGEYFVEESIALRPEDPGAPFALALSARSYVLQEFSGGPGQIALHGVQNIGGILGSATSHGCVRLDSDAIRWLAHHIGSGVPVTIRG
jgi:L,D-transpeptidase catalytic domain